MLLLRTRWRNTGRRRSLPSSRTVRRSWRNSRFSARKKPRMTIWTGRRSAWARWGVGDTNDHFSRYWDDDTEMTYPLILTKIPVKNPWEIFACLPFGNWNECSDTRSLMAAAKYWFEQYGAVPAAMSHDELEFTLPYSRSERHGYGGGAIRLLPRCDRPGTGECHRRRSGRCAAAVHCLVSLVGLMGANLSCEVEN